MALRRVNTGGQRSYQYSHGAVRNRNGRIWLADVLFSVTKVVEVSYSDDNGIHWSAAKQISQNDSYDSYGPHMAIDGGGNVHCVWVDTSGALQYSRHDDTAGPTSFTIPVAIATGLGAASQPPRICIASNNKTLVISTSGTSAAPATYLYTYSSDNGVSWSGGGSVETITGLYGLCADSAGNIHFVFSKSDGAHLQIYHRKWTGAAFTAPTALTADANFDQDTPDIAVDTSDNLNVVWCGRHTGDNGNINPRFIQYSSGAWGAIVNIRDATRLGVSYPTISYASSSGYLYVMTLGGENGGLTDMVEQYTSTNGGTSWSLTGSDISASSSSYPGLMYQRWPLWVLPATGWALTYTNNNPTTDHDAVWCYDDAVLAWNDLASGGLIFIFAGPKV